MEYTYRLETAKNRQKSTPVVKVGLAEGGTSPAFVFCGGPPGAWLAISEAGEKSNPQNKKRSRGLWLISVYYNPDRR